MNLRVGAQHWLILGILSQMPDTTMHIKMVGKLMYAHSPSIKPENAVNVLTAKGLVTYDKASGWVTLTEDGATRRRQNGRPEVIRFIHVPREYMRRP